MKKNKMQKYEILLDVKVGNDQEMAQSERNFTPKTDLKLNK